jgi:apolipoprotein D and lipocalin family protein
MQIFNSALVAFVLTTTVAAQENSMRELSTVPSVDLQIYSGLWYEIARLPNRFQEDCVRDVTATYTLDGDGFEVVNRCRKEDNVMIEAKGRARLADKDGPHAKLEVRFAPAFLSWLPFVWGDYWIIDLAADYGYAVVGEPSRKYLWILSRTNKLDADTLSRIYDRIGQQGYDPSRLVMTTQSAGSGE